MEKPEASDKSGSSGEKIAVFDLDGTITFKDTYVDFLLLCLRKRPLRILRGGELILYLLAYKAGFKSNHWLKAKFLGTIAGGLEGEELESMCRDFCEKTFERNIKPKALAELNRLKSEGYTIVLATASFDFYVERLYEVLKLDYLLCSRAKLDANGRITGALEGRNCIGSEKARRLRLLVEAQHWDRIDRAYSDDIIDLPLFQMAEKAFVVDPGATTKAQSDKLGYPVLIWR